MKSETHILRLNASANPADSSSRKLGDDQLAQPISQFLRDHPDIKIDIFFNQVDGTIIQININSAAGRPMYMLCNFNHGLSV